MSGRFRSLKTQWSIKILLSVGEIIFTMNLAQQNAKLNPVLEHNTQLDMLSEVENAWSTSVASHRSQLTLKQVRHRGKSKAVSAEAPFLSRKKSVA